MHFKLQGLSAAKASLLCSFFILFSIFFICLFFCPTNLVAHNGTVNAGKPGRYSVNKYVRFYGAFTVLSLAETFTYTENTHIISGNTPNMGELVLWSISPPTEVICIYNAWYPDTFVALIEEAIVIAPIWTVTTTTSNYAVISIHLDEDCF